MRGLGTIRSGKERKNMNQEEIAQKIEVFARRLAMIATSTSGLHNLEKEMLVKDIKELAKMLRYTS